MAAIHQEVTFDASPARVYAALMNAAEHAEFTGSPVALGSGEGDALSLFGGRIVGRNLELVPHQRIVQAWRFARWTESVDTIVRIDLRPDGARTRLVLDHDAIPDDRVALVEAHWQKRYWEALRFYLEPRGLELCEPPRRMLPERLRASYPWPERAIRVSPYFIDLDGGGRFLVDWLITRRSQTMLLEIGSFLGGSTLRWLKVSPGVEVVALDPWPDSRAGDFVASEEPWFTWPKPSEDVVRALNAPDGLYDTFLANLTPYKDRVTPVRGTSEHLLEPLAAMGLEPDIVYIDANKKRWDLDACFRLWPDARLTGDDYLWNPEDGYPMQQHVNAFAAEHGFTVVHVCHTWVLVPPA